jgi:hypothetical protein
VRTMRCWLVSCVDVAVAVLKPETGDARCKLRFILTYMRFLLVLVVAVCACASPRAARRPLWNTSDASPRGQGSAEGGGGGAN